MTIELHCLVRVCADANFHRFADAGRGEPIARNADVVEATYAYIN